MGRHAFDYDGVTALLLFLLSACGLFVLLTISQSLFSQQLLYVSVGVVLLILFSRIDAALLWWVAPWGYGVANALLLLTYGGPAIRGATRWIVMGSVQLQPSELVKPLLVLAFARFMTQYPPRQFRFLVVHAALFLVPFLLVFRQPDFGTSIIYAGVWLAMLLAGGMALGILVTVGLALGLVLPFLWQLLADYQKTRILTFLEPGLDPKGAGYNAIQSMIAVGSGQMFGRGLGRGTQSHLRFLPEYHTDFIFATLVEELGFFGGFVLLATYAGLLWRILLPFLRGWVEQAFPFLYSLGLFAMIFIQLFINTGMNMGLLPITGITLPFVSYGGSSIACRLVWHLVGTAPIVWRCIRCARLIQWVAMFAIVSLAGKQYKVHTGDTITVDRIDGKPGDTITFDRVLLTRDDKKTRVGTPTVRGVVVKAKIVAHEKGTKVAVRRFKAKVRYRKARGFRPALTKLAIVDIGTEK